MDLNYCYKFKKHLISFGARLMVVFLTIIANLFIGYGWRGFLPRLCIVGISLKLNPYSAAVSYSVTGAMKLFLFTCAILAYSIYKLIFDYTKWGVELERKRRMESEGH